QKAIATRFGISGGTVSHWFNGWDVTDRLDHVYAIADLVGLPREAVIAATFDGGDQDDDETFTVRVPRRVLRMVEFHARRRGLSRNDAIVLCMRGFVAALRRQE